MRAARSLGLLPTDPDAMETDGPSSENDPEPGAKRACWSVEEDVSVCSFASSASPIQPPPAKCLPNPASCRRPSYLQWSGTATSGIRWQQC